MSNMESKEHDVIPTSPAVGTGLEAQNAEEEFRLEEKKLIRKIDWILMPILTITLGLQVCLKSLLLRQIHAYRCSTTIKLFLAVLLSLGSSRIWWVSLTWYRVSLINRVYPRLEMVWYILLVTVLPLPL